jgi:hypothetical protein
MLRGSLPVAQIVQRRVKMVTQRHVRSPLSCRSPQFSAPALRPPDRWNSRLKPLAPATHTPAHGRAPIELEERLSSCCAHLPESPSLFRQPAKAAGHGQQMESYRRGQTILALSRPPGILPNGCRDDLEKESRPSAFQKPLQNSQNRMNTVYSRPERQLQGTISPGAAAPTVAREAQP